MNERVAVAAEPRDSALAGLSWPELGVETIDRADAGRLAGEDWRLVVALGGEPPAETGAAARVAWLRHPAPAESGGGKRIIAQSGPGVWRRAPWPVNDRLFELAGHSSGRALVVAEDDERRGRLVEELRARGVATLDAARLSVELLEQAAAVFLVPPGPALAAEAFAVLAARRMLLTPPCDPSFGLQPGTHHLVAPNDDAAANLLELATRDPGSFASLRALGAAAAAPHRASLAYPRLLADVLIEERAGRGASAAAVESRPQAPE